MTIYDWLKEEKKQNEKKEGESARESDKGKTEHLEGKKTIYMEIK